MKLDTESAVAPLLMALTLAGNAATTSTLEPLALTPLPLGSISANGWLLSELQNEAAGLAGHEHDFYMYVKDSSWLGGSSEYSDLNEGFPYWFNGLVYLAYSINDDNLKAQVHSTADYVLSHQQEDGWIGPEELGWRTFWGRYPLFLGLIGLAEANSTWTQRITDSLHTFNGLMNTMLKNNGSGYVYQEGDNISPGDFDWGRVRSQDLVISLMWLLENDPRDETDTLNDNIQMLYDGALKWEDWYNGASYYFQDLYTVPDDVNNAHYAYIHGVNVGQGLKATAVYRRFTHNDSLIQTSHDAVNWTFTYHGAASGTVIADERQDGLSPYSGAELCTAVETMYSLSYLYQALGTNSFADLCEKAAFNAMPSMITGDWWAHQYMEQINQPYSHELDTSPFSNVNTWGQTFGLEPNYPCCTVNHPQGLPKFLAAAYVVNNGGLAHVLLSPASVKTDLGENNVEISCDTSYPFSDSLTYNIQADKAFDFYVRLPEWADAATSTIVMGSQSVGINPDATTGLVQISLPAGSSTVQYNLGAPIRIENRANETVAVHRGSLLYALEVGADVSSTLPRAYNNQSFFSENYAPEQSRDYVMTNTTAWSVAIDPSTLKFHDDSTSSGLANPIFAPGAPPVYMTAQACEIEWELFRGVVPGVPPTGADKKCIGSAYSVTLVPYGSAKLHMAELPTISLTLVHE